MYRLRIAVYLALLIGACSAAAQQKPDSPRATVNEYCQLDFEGARTRSETFGKVDRMVLWHTEPGWDVARLVRSYKIISEKTAGTRSVVTVEYAVIGEVAGDEVTKNPHKERVLFTLELGDKEWVWRNEKPALVESKRAWRIKSPVICPHISVACAIQHFSSLLNDQPPDDQEELRRLISELKAIQKPTKVR